MLDYLQDAINEAREKHARKMMPRDKVEKYESLVFDFTYHQIDKFHNHHNHMTVVDAARPGHYFIAWYENNYLHYKFSYCGEHIRKQKTSVIERAKLHMWEKSICIRASLM